MPSIESSVKAQRVHADIALHRITSQTVTSSKFTIIEWGVRAVIVHPAGMRLRAARAQRNAARSLRSSAWKEGSHASFSRASSYDYRLLAP
jgi:hypothetical protein